MGVLASMATARKRDPVGWTCALCGLGALATVSAGFFVWALCNFVNG